MKTYFLDTNILLDFLGNRQPFAPFALKIFNQGRNNVWSLWTSSHSVATSYYILEKPLGAAQAKAKIAQLLQFIQVQPVTQQDLQDALHTAFKDFEDGVQHACARSHGGIDAIITRNKKDFQASQLLVLGPDELFQP